ncbi:ARM repeat-containing protein [Lactarius sanguifluus]|nr:ARM repeat-containing protein [Lactarius sanguifluus]
MEPLVPPDVTAELTQILSNLVLGDNEIRSKLVVVDERLSHRPDVYLLALTQFATRPDTVEVVTAKSPRMTLYDRLSSQTLTTIERILLHSLLHEQIDSVRRKAVDTICDLANNSMERGRPWHALQAQAFSMCKGADPSARDSAFRIFAGCPNLVMDLQTDAVLRVLQDGLQDRQSVEFLISHPATNTRSRNPYHSCTRCSTRSHRFSHAHLPKFLNTLTPLTTSHPQLFAPHLHALLSFLPALIIPSADSGPTPTLDEEAEEVRKAALEFMISLSEAKPAMVRRSDGWVSAIVRGCLGGMGELRDDELSSWLDADCACPAEDPTDDAYPHVYEQSLDRLACAVGGKAVLPAAFQHIPGMLASHDWKLRHAGLMAIASVAEGTSKVMQNELGKVVDLITPLFLDPYPRVRYAACQCIGQLCTDLEEVIQAQYHQQIFAVLIPTLEVPEPRVHAHAAAALINFCEGVERDTLLPYLDPIVERLLKLLNPAQDGSRPTKRYVQEQAVTTLAMVADASETTFAKHYSSIMPLLLNVLRNANTSEYRKLRAKAMECCWSHRYSLTISYQPSALLMLFSSAIAVGREVFRADAGAFVELLIRIQTDTMLPHYLIATWAKVCQAMGPEFEPYLPVVMPPLFRAANAKADVSVYEDEEAPESKEGWDIIEMDGQQVGIRTSAIDEKCQAFETLVIYCSTLGARFAPYLQQSLEMVLQSLRFVLHDGVREACALVLPMLISCGKASNAIDGDMVGNVMQHVASVISQETDSTFLASLFKCATDSMRAWGDGTPETRVALENAAKQQLQALADRRKARSARTAAEIEEDREDLALLEEMEEFALEELAKMLAIFDPNHPLLVAVPSVRDLGLGLGAWDGDGDGGDE